ncbi:MAG TPA: MarC family protein [Aromatoleum sp.]|uniref:MarC family protein n=1 Tax=Aromatoleum sp. TaxID=2307007 RepID=UPI002B466F0D|nr:MarC family protein [Aromatoleum sp.]HJV26244.1 MarC family protein [Aromatoleum sp.]
MNEFLQAFVSLLAITNPIIAAPLFLGIVAGMPVAGKRRAAGQAAMAVLAILAGAAIGGRYILELFGISLDAFRTAGGLVIILVGLEMLRGSPSEIQRDEASPDDAQDRIVVPFAMPLVAGPGAITTAITLSVAYPSRLYLPVIALFASIATAIVLWLVLRLALVRQRLATPRVERIFTRFMGLILVAIGFQIGMLGIRDFFGLGGS